MSTAPNKRHTQLDFKRLRGLWEPISSQLNGASAEQEIPDPTVSPIAIFPEYQLSNEEAKPVKSTEHGAGLPVVVREGSPWDHYEQMYALRLGIDHRAIVAEERHPGTGELADVYSIRRFADLDMKTRQNMLRDIQNPNFVTVCEIFWLENICYVVSEHLPCSLYEVRANEHLTELRIAAIVGQVSVRAPLGSSIIF